VRGMRAQGELSYESFGEAFIFATVTPERVVAAVKRIAGDTVSLGPLRAGPAGAASVTAHGTIGDPEADEIGSNPLTYAVRLPVSLSLVVRVGAVGRFEATGSIGLRLDVRTVSPLAIVIDVAPVDPSDTSFKISSRGVQSRVMQRAGDVAGELSLHAARYVNEQINRPEASRFTRIDLLPLIESSWSSM
jgi:hypothetical protein